MMPISAVIETGPNPIIDNRSKARKQRNRALVAIMSTFCSGAQVPFEMSAGRMRVRNPVAADSILASYRMER